MLKPLSLVKVALVVLDREHQSKGWVLYSDAIVFCANNDND